MKNKKNEVPENYIPAPALADLVGHERKEAIARERKEFLTVEDFGEGTLREIREKLHKK